MAELERPIHKLLRDPVSDDLERRLWRKVGEQRARDWTRSEARGPSTLGTLAIAAAALGVLVALPYLFDRLAPAPRREAAVRATTAEASLRFDHAVARATPGTRVRRGPASGDPFAFALDDGEVDVEVEPGHGRFRIDCGIATVEVIGTWFTLRRTPELVHVAVAHGRVRVTDLITTSTVMLGAGEELTVHSTRHDDEPASPPMPPDEPRRAPEPARPRWRDLADRGDSRAAWETLGADGFRATTSTSGPAELLDLADVARRSGHPAEAIAPLERLLDRFPADSRAPLAAYTLGVVRMDQLRDPAGAAASFERARALGLPPHLEESALGRLAVSRGRAGDAIGAREAAQDYLARHPDGPLAASVAAWADGSQ